MRASKSRPCVFDTSIRWMHPKQLRSPTWLLHFQKGNSFECATLLASLLLGQSYNAFVASGYASREQVLRDMRKITCPYLPKHEQMSPPVVIPERKYQLKFSSNFQSKFLLELEDQKRRKIEAELQLAEEERQRMIIESERPPPDKYFGHRIHAWVIILPEQKGMRDGEITEPIFIETSSGVSYNPNNIESNLLYLWVESIWNDQNYWVNMQPREKDCSKINWDLSKIQFWEHLLPGEPRTERNDVNGVEESVQQDKHIDMPFSYIDKIQIQSIDYEKRYPNGRKVIFYKKAKVELYAPYIEANGLIQRITVYEDYEYIIPVESHEKFLNRNDYLIECTRNFNTNSVMDMFEKGRSDQCKAHRYFVTSSQIIDTEREIDFYHFAQVDRLSRIQTGPLYSTQYYVDRDDCLYYRHTEFTIDKGNSAVDGVNSRRITKITEKYHRNEKIPACKDIAVREFSMDENKIYIKFHYDTNQSSRATRTFIKPSVADRGDRLIFDPTMIDEYHPDPTAPREKNVDLFYDLDKHLNDEDHCIACIRDSETEIISFLNRRADENINLQLMISLFDINRIAETSAAEFKTVHDPSQFDIQEINQLGPYLARIGNPPHISKAEAYLLRDDCLNYFKRISVDKANCILRTLEERAIELEKMQVQLTQSEDLKKAEEEQILAKTDEISFNLHVLETYLNWYRDLVPEKYRVLVDRLEKNPHLRILYEH